MIRASSISEAARAVRTPSASASKRKSSRSNARSRPQNYQDGILSNDMTQGLTFAAVDFPTKANANSNRAHRSCSETGRSKRCQKHAKTSETIVRAFEWGQALLDLTSTAPGLAWPERESPDQIRTGLEKSRQKDLVFKRRPLEEKNHAEVSLQTEQAALEERVINHGDGNAEEGRSPTPPMQEMPSAQEVQLVSEEKGSPAKPQRKDDSISHRSQSVPCSRRNAATDEAHAEARIRRFQETRAMWGQRATCGGQADGFERHGKTALKQQSTQEAEVAFQRLLVCNDHDELRRMRRLINESFCKEGAD
mmetsp:Transcript_65118/g.128609  ORF Transcript_65118/g.128609 Transcript_65118/m.128609 type:complete len:308 (+) Transcript_65118:27-950(+)